MPRKAAEPKEKKSDSPDLIKFNKGYPRRPIAVGDKVSMYKIPYREGWQIGSGIVKKIVREGELGAWCDVQREGHSNTQLHFIYLGRVHQSRTKLQN